ncbi:MAG: radical SAM protein [Candidatus Riflebacteria bacterium]|nr:radical SAM protein [Candidatus Riflebacteria bacterium]
MALDLVADPSGWYRLTLALTYRCNMRCSYCYVHRGDGAATMTEQTGLAAIDLGLASIQAGGMLHLGFFGGEPLLEPELLSRIASEARRRARDQRKTVRPGVTTNGTRLVPETIDLLSRELIDVTVSLDGTREAHDTNRRLPGGAGTHDLVAEGVRRALDAGLAVGINMVVDPSNVAWLSAGVDEIVAMGIAAIELSPNYDAAWSREALATMTEEYEAVGEIYARCARTGRPIGVSFIDSKLAAAVRGGTPGGGRCSFGVREVAVDPAGRLYPCERLLRDDGTALHAIGQLPGAVDPVRLARLREPLGRVPADCRECGLVDLCTHWCACVNNSRTGCFQEPDGLVCYMEGLAVRVTEKVMRTVLKPIPVATGGGRS